MDVAGQRITVMGLGRHGGGVAAARFLARNRARVTVTDLADADSLFDSLRALRDIPIARYTLGRHDEADFRAADAVVVNPAVRPGHPALQWALDAGALLTSEIELFLERCRAPVIGVTGSNGKSTTAAMIAFILKAAGKRAWLGGNIGVSLLEDVDSIAESDWGVLELSSFQLAHLSSAARFPRIAVVTNCAPNHLDWHGTFEHYRAAKQRIIREQAATGLAFLNADESEVSSWVALARGQVLPVWSPERIPALQIPGSHNRANAQCAAGVAEACGCDEEAIKRALAEFRSLPHRLEFVGEIRGRRFFNDSKATTPEATMAALDAMEQPIWLLAGGYDKGIDLGRLARTIAWRARGAALFGSTRGSLHAQVAAADPSQSLFSTEHMRQAFEWCWRQSRPGDTILLSPACASVDQFDDFADRGRQFAALVGELSSDVVQPCHRLGAAVN